MPGGTGAESAARLTLEAVSGPPLGAIVAAPEKVLVLGRSSQSDVVLGDEAVSRKHCTISAHQGTWFIEDLGSRHGTYVQSVKLGAGERMPLKHGDVVGVGPWMLRAKIGSGAASTYGARVVTLMGGPAAPGTTSPVGAGRAGASIPGAAGQVGSTMMRERVERVAERDLAAVNQNRLKLLMEVAAAVAGTGSEESLARMIVQAAAQGSGFPRAFLLKDETVGSDADGAGGVDTLSVMAEVDPDAAESAAGSAEGLAANTAGGQAASASPALPAASSFSRSLIAAARKGEIVRLTSDAPMQAQSIMSLGIQTALCVPIMTGAGAASVGAFLYLDSRRGEKSDGKTRGAVAPLTGGGGGHSDAAAYCGALAKMYGLALGNISRLELERRQKELVRDLEAASEAQRLIMPPAQGSHGRVRYAMKSKSGRYVAGDLFDVIDLEDGRVGVLLGDVAGKGVPAAILMATAQTHLHVALREWKDPARAVRAVNEHICSHMASSKFISLWIGVFEPAANGGGILTYVDAGHGYWLIVGKDGDTVHRNEAATGIPLGIEPTFDFEAARVEIKPGQRLVVFSDGVVEQPGGENGDQFGVEGAIGALRGGPSEGEDVERVFKAVLVHAKGPNLADDTTVASVGM